MTISRRLTVLVGLLTLLFVGNAAPASAQTDDALPDQVIIFVIDLSGSMRQPFDGERSKLDVAKEAFEAAFTGADENAFVGLRVYGDQNAPTDPASREANCTTDTRLVVPITKVDREQLITEVQAFEALGDTPIGLALAQAELDIPDGTLGTVVLFSDGRDECFDADLDGDPASGPSWGEDPCLVAQRIAGEGVDLRIDRVETVGFGADAAAELELRCIADKTGGSYTPIETPEDARDVLPELLAQLSSPREAERLGGQPIAGTPSQEGAPDLARLDTGSGADGRYVDTIELNSERWYRVEEYGPGGGTFTATVFGLPGQEGIRFGMRMYLPETDQTFFESRSDDNAGIPRQPTASIRCPGCSVTGGPNEVFWVLSLSADNPDLGGTYDIEILTEGAAFGGLPTSCEEPQECWYDGQIVATSQTLADTQAVYDEAASVDVPAESLQERDDLADEVAEAEEAAAIASARQDELLGEVTAAEAAAADAAARRDELVALQAEADDGGMSLGIPLVLLVIGALLGGAGFVMLRRAPSPAAAASGDEASAAFGHIEVPEPDEQAASEAPGEAVPPDDRSENATAPVVDPLTRPAPPPGGLAPPAAPSGAEQPEDSSAEPGLEVPEPGWYDDPHGAGRLRWWDGTDWTDHTRDDDGGT